MQNYQVNIFLPGSSFTFADFEPDLLTFGGRYSPISQSLASNPIVVDRSYSDSRISCSSNLKYFSK